MSCTISGRAMSRLPTLRSSTTTGVVRRSSPMTGANSPRCAASQAETLGEASQGGKPHARRNAQSAKDGGTWSSCSSSTHACRWLMSRYSLPGAASDCLAAIATLSARRARMSGSRTARSSSSSGRTSWNPRTMAAAAPIGSGLPSMAYVHATARSATTADQIMSPRSMMPTSPASSVPGRTDDDVVVVPVVVDDLRAKAIDAWGDLARELVEHALDERAPPPVLEASQLRRRSTASGGDPTAAAAPSPDA